MIIDVSRIVICKPEIQCCVNHCCCGFFLAELLLGKPSDYRFLSNGAVPVPSIDDKQELQDAIVSEIHTTLFEFSDQFLK